MTQPYIRTRGPNAPKIVEGTWQALCAYLKIEKIPKMTRISNLLIHIFAFDILFKDIMFLISSALGM